LFEEDRCSFNKLNLAALLIVFGDNSNDDKDKIKWLLDRLKTPVSEMKKRTREDVASAWEAA